MLLFYRSGSDYFHNQQTAADCKDSKGNVYVIHTSLRQTTRGINIAICTSFYLPTWGKLPLYAEQVCRQVMAKKRLVIIRTVELQSSNLDATNILVISIPVTSFFIQKTGGWTKHADWLTSYLCISFHSSCWLLWLSNCRICWLWFFQIFENLLPKHENERLENHFRKGCSIFGSFCISAVRKKILSSRTNYSIWNKSIYLKHPD